MDLSPRPLSYFDCGISNGTQRQYYSSTSCPMFSRVYLARSPATESMHVAHCKKGHFLKVGHYLVFLQLIQAILMGQ